MVELHTLKDFGDGFVRVREHPHNSLYNRMLQGRTAIQFPCGNIILGGEYAIAASVISDKDAARLHIHRMHGFADWIEIFTCRELSDTEADDLMNFVKEFVTGLVANIQTLP